MKHEVNDAKPQPTLASLIERNRALPLGDYLRGLARASLLLSAIGTAGCGGGSSDAAPWIDPAEAIMPICDAREGPVVSGFWLPTQGLTPALSYDYLGVYACSPGPGVAGYLIDSEGEACQGASDPDQCEMLIENQIDCPVLHVRSGDELEVIKAGDDLLRFFGTVDTAQEALLVAFLNRGTIQCGDSALGSARRVGDDFQVIVTRITASCDPIEQSRFLLQVTRDGSVTELRSEVYSSEAGTCIGRRPQGLLPSDESCSGNTKAGAHFAGIATLEAAAVIAFRRLATELRHLGAPASLIEDVLRAADDEVRHADVMGAVARQFGAVPAAPHVEAARARSAFAIALDNAVEGCIRETFGALAGSYQSFTAADPLVAEAMRQVSEDEIFHAELSVRVDAFLDTLLTAAERKSLAQARRRAIAELRLETTISPDDEIATLAGLPPRGLALRWIDQLERDVWAA